MTLRRPVANGSLIVRTASKLYASAKRDLNRSRLRDARTVSVSLDRKLLGELLRFLSQRLVYWLTVRCHASATIEVALC